MSAIVLLKIVGIFLLKGRCISCVAKLLLR
jgi:hypothetical protein